MPITSSPISCGVQQLYGLPFNSSVENNLYHLCQNIVRRRPPPLRGYYVLCAILIWSDNTRKKRCLLMELTDYMVKQKLAKAFFSDKTKNPNSGNYIFTCSLVLNPKKLINWFDEEKEKRAKK